MSARICHSCISYLNSWQSFKNRCDIAQKRHRGLLDQQIMRQRSLSIVGKAPGQAAASSSAAAGSVMNQQQILNHAAQQQRRQEAIMHQRAQMRQQRILKEALTSGGGGGGAGAQPKKRMPLPQLNSTAIDVVSVKC